MSLADERMLKLMAYADGELDGKEREEVEAWIAEDNHAVRFANEVANLGDLVKMGHLESSDAKATAGFDIADVVIGKVAREESTKVRRRPVTSIDAARARRQRSFKMGAAAVTVLALAAAVFLVARNKDEQPMARAPVPAVQPSPSNNGNGPGVDVDLVETPGHSVSVFYLPSESSLTTTSVVVWVDETGGK